MPASPAASNFLSVTLMLCAPLSENQQHELPSGRRCRSRHLEHVSRMLASPSAVLSSMTGLAAMSPPYHGCVEDAVDDGRGGT